MEREKAMAFCGPANAVQQLESQPRRPKQGLAQQMKWQGPRDFREYGKSLCKGDIRNRRGPRMAFGFARRYGTAERANCLEGSERHYPGSRGIATFRNRTTALSSCRMGKNGK